MPALEEAIKDLVACHILEITGRIYPSCSHCPEMAIGYWVGNAICHTHLQQKIDATSAKYIEDGKLFSEDDLKNTFQANPQLPTNMAEIRSRALARLGLMHIKDTNTGISPDMHTPQGGLTLSGWFCLICKIFNGEAKEILPICRACGATRPE